MYSTLFSMKHPERYLRVLQCFSVAESARLS